MTADMFVDAVLDHVPPGLPVREQIASDLRSHIAERLAAGESLDAVLRQFGDPLELAESYLAAIPLESAPLLRRIVAKVIDFLAVAIVVIAVTMLLFAILPEPFDRVLPVLCLMACIMGFVVYTAWAEYAWGRTVGKRLMGLRVVRESGARITVGQTLLRQLPFVGQFFFIDALFALFTTKHQRAFEMLTKTRAVAGAVMACLALTTVGLHF
jgi:uncharacterized RDD family membrane protein YckC